MTTFSNDPPASATRNGDQDDSYLSVAMELLYGLLPLLGRYFAVDAHEPDTITLERSLHHVQTCSPGREHNTIMC